MSKIYLDSAVVIYLVERVEPYYTLLQTTLDPSDDYLASHLTRLECRVLPLRKGDMQLLADYEAFFGEQVHEMIELSASVMDKAAEIRAFYNFSVADAIHLAAAVVSGCEVFLTNDLRLTSFAEIVVKTL